MGSDIMLVEKHVFSVDRFETIKGEVIPDCTMGYEIYGELNQAKDNVILVGHHFSGSSHAAGMYTEADPLPGFWNAVIGPGKAFDTNKYCVICTDMLCNVSPRNPMVATSGPASINPATGKPWGMSFPIIHVEDMVNMQHALLNHLGIKKLHAVAGPSGGSVQAFQWAVDYPDMVDKVIAVVSPGVDMPDYAMAMLHQWTYPIYHDPNWNKGDYYDGTFPREGTINAFRAVVLSAMHASGFQNMFGRAWANDDKNPADSFNHDFKVNAYLDETAETRSACADPNHILYMVKACELFDVKADLHKMRAKVLLVPSELDMLMSMWAHERTKKILADNHIQTEEFVIKGSHGHLDGLMEIEQASGAISEFLAK